MPVPDRHQPESSSSSQSTSRSKAANPFRPIPKTPLQKALEPHSKKLQADDRRAHSKAHRKTHHRQPSSAKTPRSKKPPRSRPHLALPTFRRPSLKKISQHLLPLLGLLATGAIITGSGILSAKFILEPKSVAWLNDYLPEFLQIPVPEWDRPQTLADIEKQIQTDHRKMGEMVELNSRDRLLPIIQPGYNCITKCDRIAELRIYRPAKANGPKRNEPHYRMIAQLAVGALEDWHIVNALAVSETGSSNTGGESLPLENYDTFEAPEANTGHWFNLTGKRNQGEYAVTYGQLFHYDPGSTTLTALVKWAGPTEQPIAWKQITGSPTPELLINHTIGLEPSYQAYLVQPKGTPELRPISLTQATHSSPEFRTALNLIKAALWSLAADRLKQIKNTGETWNNMAQAQLDLVQYHAKVTRDQAQQNSASPFQQVIAKLLDGRWKEAFTSLEKDPSTHVEIQESLKTETVRLWKRLSIAIDEDPGNPYLQAWTAAVMLDRDGLSKTRTWLNHQGGSSTRTQALQILAPTIAPKPKPSPSPSPTPDGTAPSPSPSPTPLPDGATPPNPSSSPSGPIPMPATF